METCFQRNGGGKKTGIDIDPSYKLRVNAPSLINEVYVWKCTYVAITGDSPGELPTKLLIKHMQAHESTCKHSSLRNRTQLK